MSTSAVAEAAAPGVVRPPADRFMRRVLFLPVDAPKMSLMAAQNAFSKSIAISASRCLLTYVALPLLGPVLGWSSVVGPYLGVALSLVSMVAIFFACRRFFAADHRWRWGYTAIGGGIFVLVTAQLVIDLGHIFS